MTGRNRTSLIFMHNRKRYIQVFEHESIFTYQKEDGRFITQDQFDQLCAYNDQHGNKYFTVIRKGIKFKQYVGVIQIGRTAIEILPKTDNRDTQFWHKVLLQMLAECHKIKRESVSKAILRKRENSLLDLYIEMYLDQVEKLVHKGLVKKYLRHHNQNKALKGKLLFADHIRSNLVHKERFYTEHTVYTSDNIFNQIIKKCLKIITKLNYSSNLKDRAIGLSVYFHSISDKPKISEKTFQQIPVGRSTEKYRKALNIARLIILNYSPDIKTGTENLLAILFDMNDLWEEYIYRQLMKTRKDDVEVLFQRRKKFWKNKEIKPDIIINKGDESFVLDTKWKVLDQAKPSDNDLKQIFVYNIYWSSYKSLLLYPKTPNSPSDTYGKYWLGMDKEHGCLLGFIDIIDESGSLKKDCSEQIWNFFEIKN